MHRRPTRSSGSRPITSSCSPSSGYRRSRSRSASWPRRRRRRSLREVEALTRESWRGPSGKTTWPIRPLREDERRPADRFVPPRALHIVLDRVARRRTSAGRPAARDGSYESARADVDRLRDESPGHIRSAADSSRPPFRPGSGASTRSVSIDREGMRSAPQARVRRRILSVGITNGPPTTSLASGRFSSTCHLRTAAGKSAAPQADDKVAIARGVPRRRLSIQRRDGRRIGGRPGRAATSLERRGARLTTGRDPVVCREVD